MLACLAESVSQCLPHFAPFYSAKYPTLFTTKLCHTSYCQPSDTCLLQPVLPLTYPTQPNPPCCMQTSLTSHLVCGSSPQHTLQQSYPPHMDLTLDMPTCFSNMSHLTHTHLLQHALPHAYSLLPNLCLYSPTYLATVHSHHKPIFHPFTHPTCFIHVLSIHLTIQATLYQTTSPHAYLPY